MDAANRFTPDTANAIFECGDKMIVWEQICWLRPSESASIFGIEIRGTEGMLRINDEGATIHDGDRKLVAEFQGGRGDAEHLRDFLDAVRDGHRTNANIEEGHKSALFCHLGNVAYRTGQAVRTDSANGRIIDNPAAEKLWGREYRPGWEPAV